MDDNRRLLEGISGEITQISSKLVRIESELTGLRELTNERFTEQEKKCNYVCVELKNHIIEIKDSDKKQQEFIDNTRGATKLFIWLIATFFAIIGLYIAIT